MREVPCTDHQNARCPDIGKLGALSVARGSNPKFDDLWQAVCEGRNNRRGEPPGLICEIYLMSALHPKATAKADLRERSCLLYPQKRTCAVQ
jgi:hypothetical protein